MLDLTTSQLKCLLTVMELSSTGNAVASKEIAVQMRVSRPSVHRLLEGLARRGLIDKEPYTDYEENIDCDSLSGSQDKKNDS